MGQGFHLIIPGFRNICFLNLLKLSVAATGILIVLTQPLAAQDAEGGIKGVVRDAVTMTPLERVNIIVLDTPVGAISDDHGRFSISGLKSGEYYIRASMIGYESLQLLVQVNKGSFAGINLDLHPVSILLDSVGILGKRPERDLIVIPTLEPRSLDAVHSTVTIDEIRKQGSHTIIEALKYVPGGHIETRGRKVKQFFSVRGQKYPYPDYAINGIWQKEFRELPYFFPSSDIESIKIVRSSAALLTGLSGLAGVIDLQTREYDSLETALELEYGSFKSFHGQLSHGGKFGSFSYAAGGGYDRTSGPAGMHAAEKMMNMHGRFIWEPDSSLSVTGNIFHMNGMRQLTVAMPPADQKFIDFRQTYDPLLTTLVNLKTYYRPATWASTELQLFYSGRKPVYIDEVREIRTNEYDFEWGLNLIQSLAISPANTLRFGGLYNHWLAPNGKRFYAGKRCDSETISFVAVDEHRLGPAVFDAGIRWTRTFLNEYGAFNIEGSGGAFKNVDPIIDEWQDPVIQANAGVTLIMLSDKVSLHLHTALGQVKPREGSLDTALNVPANETRLKFDLGLIRSWVGGSQIVLSSFYVRQENAIVYSGQTYQHPISGKIMELYENRNQEQYGIEFETRSGKMLNLFSFFYNITLMNSLVLTGGERIRDREHPGLITNIGIFLTRSGFDLNLFGKYVSQYENDRFADPAYGPQPLGDYFTLDMSGGYAIGPRRSTRVYLNIINITNKKYSTVVGYPDFGRKINIGVRLII
ncbi:MAG: TonB-dependent receptor [Bacteroidales bacterium]|nr:TonB-dependent receptor [Bacteroidales bacterium]